MALRVHTYTDMVVGHPVSDGVGLPPLPESAARHCVACGAKLLSGSPGEGDGLVVQCRCRRSTSIRLQSGVVTVRAAADNSKQPGRPLRCPVCRAIFAVGEFGPGADVALTCPRCAQVIEICWVHEAPGVTVEKTNSMSPVEPMSGATHTVGGSTA